MRSVTTPDGRTLTVREAGDPAGAPVLSISGTPGSSTIAAAHARDAEQRGIRLFSYDRPGYGGSTRQKGRAVADCAADITAVCDDLGVDRLCVWGISGAEGLDFFAGMGEKNVEEFGVIFEGEEAHRASMEEQRAQL